MQKQSKRPIKFEISTQKNKQTTTLQATLATLMLQYNGYSKYFQQFLKHRSVFSLLLNEIIARFIDQQKDARHEFYALSN